jgi:hypothetical protein
MYPDGIEKGKTMRSSWSKAGLGGTRKETNINGVAAIIVILFVCLGPCIYRASEDTVTITVTEKDRVTSRAAESSQYLVWTTQGECFSVSDSVSYFSCNASDRYGRLKAGKTYRCTVAGWRFGCASMYRNIISFQEVKGGE